MAVPGLKPELPLRAKVRVGEKDDDGRTSFLDYFRCTDPHFESLAGVKPSSLLVRFPYAEMDRVWSSGLEKWMRARASGKPILGCYAKDGKTAHRLGNERDAEGFIILNPAIKGQPRNEMPCLAQQCPYYGPKPAQGCRPIGRLNFFLVGDDVVDKVFRIETKGLDSIEGIEGVLEQYPDLRDGVFQLTVSIHSRAQKKWPVLSIAKVAEGVEATAPAPPSAPQTTPRQALKDLLVERGQWPPNEQQTAWIKKTGYGAALEALRRRG